MQYNFAYCVCKIAITITEMTNIKLRFPGARCLILCWWNKDWKKQNCVYEDLFGSDVGATENEGPVLEETTTGNGQFDISKSAACQEGGTPSRRAGAE